MSVVVIEMVIERERERTTAGCSIHVEENWTENKSLRYTTSKWKV